MWNPRRVASCMTRSGKPQVPQEKCRAVTPKEAQQEPTQHPARGEEEDTAPSPQKETPHTNKGTTRDCGLQLKHTRLATVGEREEENRQTEQKREHQKCSLGIKAKIPKKNRRPQTNAKLGEKTATTAALRKASRRIGAVIVAATIANATIARTNAT